MPTKNKRFHLDEVPITSVDTRSDTTRQGYHEGRGSSVQSRSYHPFVDFYTAIEEKSRTVPKDSNVFMGDAPAVSIATPMQVVRATRNVNKVVNAAKKIKNSLVELANRGNRITLKNASKISDAKWDKAYNTAVNAGDMIEAQRLRDLHFAVKSNTKVVDANGNPVKTYHTVNEAYPADFNEFNPTIEGTHSAIYTAKDPMMSGTYTNRIVSEGEREAYIQAGIENMKNGIKDNAVHGSYLREFKEALNTPASAREYVINRMPQLKQAVSKGRQKELYVRLNSPLTINGRGKHWNNIPINELPEDVYKYLKSTSMNGYTTRDIENAQKATGNYDGAIISDITDYGSSWKSTMRRMEPTNVYQINSPNNIKYSDAITYDDVGKIIPLSKRDNFRLSDMRYAFAPILGIGAGYTVNRKLNDK